MRQCKRHMPVYGIAVASNVHVRTFVTPACVCAVNTATFTKQGTGRSSGVNFALPVDMVATVVPKLIVFGQAADKRI